MRFQAKKEMLKNAVIASVEGNSKIQELKKSGKQDEEIILGFFFSGSNQSNALLVNLLGATKYKIKICYVEENIKYRSYFLSTYKNREIVFSKMASELDFIGVDCDALIFDILPNEIQRLFLLEKKTNFIFPFLEIPTEILPTIIISNNNLYTTNFDEIYQKHQKIIEEIKKENRLKYKVDHALESRPYNALPYIYRYILSHGDVKQCEFIVENYGENLDRDLVVHTLIEVIFLDERNDNLIGLCVKKSKLSDEEISLLLQYYVWLNVNNIDYKKLAFFYKKFIEKIDDNARDMLLQFAVANRDLVDFLVKNCVADVNKYLVFLVEQNAIAMLEYVMEKYYSQIKRAALNKALCKAYELDKKIIIAKLIAAGANENLLKVTEKNYGWSKFLADEKLFLSVPKDGVEWLKSSFDSYVDVMNDFLFNENYGYYASALVKIGGNAADYTTNVTNSKAFAFLLTLLAIEKWKKCDRPETFVILELCGGNGKLANDILTISEILSQNIFEIKDFYKALNHRTVDISDGLSKLQQKRNEKFIKEGKFKVILSDVTDEKWLEKFDLKNEKGFVFANELIDQFIPNPLIVKDGRQAFEQLVVNHILVADFKQFYQLFAVKISDIEAKKIYEELLERSQKYKANFTKYFSINCVDNNLIVSAEDFRKIIIPLILEPRINQAKSMRHKIFHLEEEQEEFIRNNDKKSAEILGIRINSLVKKVDELAEEMTDIWQHFLLSFVAIPKFDYDVRSIDLKYLTTCKVYPKNFAIHYEEKQLEKLLEIIVQLKNIDEFFCFEYGALDLQAEEKCRELGYYAFSYLVKDLAVTKPLQEKFNDDENKISDIFAKLFLGVDITIDLNFPKARVIAKDKGWSDVGLYCHQREFDGYLKEIDLQFYQEALQIMKVYDYDMEEDMRKFRNIGETFKVMSLRK